MRGTGLSEPYDCPELQRGVGPEWLTLSECAKRLGERYVSYRTQAGVDDLDDVRRALGVRRISLYGDSYGTYFAQSYAFRHPDTLRALVLDSAYPARGESPWYGSLIRTGNQAAGARLPALARVLGRRRPPGSRASSATCAARGAASVRLLSRVRGGDLRHAGLLPARSTTPGTQLLRGNAEALEPAHRAAAQARAPAPARVHAGRRAGRRLQRLPDDLGQGPRAEPERRAQLERAIDGHAATSARSPRARSRCPRTSATSSASPGRSPTPVYEPPIPPGAKPTTAPVLVVSGEMDNLTTPQEGALGGRRVPELDGSSSPATPGTSTRSITATATPRARSGAFCASTRPARLSR